MSAIALLSILGLALILPVFLDDDNEDENITDPADPSDPPEPPINPETPAPDNTIDETAENDTLVTTGESQTLHGLAGEDTLTATEASTDAVLNGGRDDDTLIIDGDNAVAHGHRGDDTFEISGSGTYASGDTGDDSFTVEGADHTIWGGKGADTLIGNGLSGTLSGGVGEDVLSIEDGEEAGDGSLLEGGSNQDSLTTAVTMALRDSETAADTLTGGGGEDVFNIELNFNDATTAAGEVHVATITDFDPATEQLNISTDLDDESDMIFNGVETRVAEDGSYTDIISHFRSTTESAEPTSAIIRLEGVNDLDFESDNVTVTSGDYSYSPTEQATAGDDILHSPGYFDPGDTDNAPLLNGVLSGLEGDDVLIQDARDDLKPYTMDGGEGNDTLIASELEVAINTTLDGGAGDDLLISDRFVGNSYNTFITGEGADTIYLTTQNPGNPEDIDIGAIGNVTDFTPGEDMILVDPAWIFDPDDAAVTNTDFVSTLTLTEDPDGEFTDVAISLRAAQSGQEFSAVLRLEGLTGLTEEDLGFAVGTPEGAPFIEPSVIVGT